MMKIQPIPTWAEDDRPREKLLMKGRRNLSDAELIAILIGSGSQDVSAVQLAQEIMGKAENDLQVLSGFSIQDLMKFKGIGEAKAISIVACLEVARRKSGHTEREKVKIKSSKDAFQILKADFDDLYHEEFFILLLNRANTVIGKIQISKGGFSGTVADGKMIFSKALEKKASAVILAHNHPSGQLIPSEIDKTLTQKLVDFGKCIDLQILDHLIFSNEKYFSFADSGLI